MLKFSRTQRCFDTRRSLLWLFLLLPALTVWHPNNTPCAFSDDPPFIPADSLSESDKARIKEFKQSADEISVRELNECHLAMLGRMILVSPDELELKLAYAGIVRDQGNNVVIHPKFGREVRGGLRGIGNIGNPLGWNVSSHKSSSVIFSMSVTVRKTDRTVAECPLKKRTLYVNIDFVDKNEEITKKRDDLGGVSVLEFVKRLEKGPSDLEKQE